MVKDEKTGFLNIQPSLDIINTIAKTITIYTDIPIEFIIPSSYCIIAETIGRFYRLPSTLGYNKLLNLFTILGSPPHLTHRSDLIKYIKYIQNVAISKYHGEIKSKPEEIENDIKAHSLQTGGSTEGLLDIIDDLYSKGIKSFCVIDPEIGKTFESMNKKDSYMSGTTDTLCRLFTRDDFTVYYSRKSKQGKKFFRKLPTDISFSILGSMQNPEQYLNSKTAQVGTLRRLWINALRGINLPPYKPLITKGLSKDDMFKELKEIGLYIGELMVSAHNNDKFYHHTELRWNDNVIDLINGFDKEYTLHARENDDDPVALSKVTFGEICAKLGGIRAISQNRIDITVDDINIAKKLLIESAKRSDIALENMDLTPQEIKDNKNYNEFIRYINEGLDKNTIQSRFSGKYGKSKVKGKEFQDLLREILHDYMYSDTTGWVKK